MYQECKEYVLRLIQSNLERQVADDDDGSKHEQLETEKLMEKLAGPSQRVSCHTRQLRVTTLAKFCENLLFVNSMIFE